IDQSLEAAFGADRKLDRDRLRAEAVDDVLQALEEVRADLVHLVGEDDARNLVLVALAPNRLGLRLDALVRIEHDHRAVEHAQRTLHLDGEVDVAGRVDDVEALAVPERGRRGRRDRDAALLLLLHEVHGGGAVVHFADLVALAGVIEDPLGGRGLAGIDVRHDAEVAVVLDGVDAGHDPVRLYQRYCANARLASAIRCVSSRFFTAFPRLFDASSSSAESRSTIVFSLRSRAAAMIQRIPSAWRRSLRTSTGTW